MSGGGRSFGSRGFGGWRAGVLARQTLDSRRSAADFTSPSPVPALRAWASRLRQVARGSRPNKIRPIPRDASLRRCLATSRLSRPPGPRCCAGAPARSHRAGGPASENPASGYPLPLPRPASDASGRPALRAPGARARRGRGRAGGPPPRCRARGRGPAHHRCRSPLPRGTLNPIRPRKT
jgi:hypothetical protein